MFVQYYGMVEQPFDEVEARLLALGDGIGETAAVAYRHGEDLIARIGGAGMAKNILLDLKRPVRSEGATTIPLVWWATGTPGLFPTMDAELTVATIAEGLTQVLFQGTYQPPLGAVGRVLDRALLRRLAEISVKDFVDRLITQLAEGSDAG